jgi:plasmid maintenance system antidote protein VapI
MLNKKLNELINNVLENRGISQAQLAKEMGVSSPLITYILNGQLRISYSTAERLSAALDYPIETLLMLQINWLRENDKKFSKIRETVKKNKMNKNIVIAKT